METITRREWIISIIVVCAVLALAVVIEPVFKDQMLTEIRTYERALKVDNDAHTFVYAQKTNVGDVLAIGEMKALEPQSITELVNQYGMIQKVKEHYTEHARQVFHTSCTGSGKNKSCYTYYTTEIYYTWDFVQSWESYSQKFEYLGVTFSLAQLDLTPVTRIELSDSTMSPNYVGYYDRDNLYAESFLGVPTGNDRYYFVELPITFAATILVRFTNDKSSDPFTGQEKLHVNTSQSPAQIIQSKKDGLDRFDVFYYGIIILLVILVYLGWAASNNDELG